ncbi:MAG: hypothetical protein NT027_04405 [Proteobacteria bacterium]|nr:hypothetical protein [Pseudomonadota bacterium]
MIPMFNQGGRSATLLSFANQSFVGQNGGFTYNDSPYVHALNRTLQLEKAVVGLYAVKIRKSKLRHDEISFRTKAHLEAQRQLVRLIFSQRGLPDSDPATFTAVASTFAARASKWLPSPMNEPILDASLRGVEHALADRYLNLLKLAPANDHPFLLKLLEQVRDFSDEQV